MARNGATRTRRTTGPNIQLNLNVRGMGASATLAINERCDQLRREGRRIVKLGLGQSPFPVPDDVVAELRANAAQKDYLPVRGLTALREAVAGYHRRRHDIPNTGSDVLVGPGSKELMFLLQLVYYGDLVVPTPAWVSYEPQARIIGRQVRLISTSAARGWRLTADELEALCRDDPGRPRIVVLNYPSNPTGATYTADALQDIARVARAHRVVLLSDEIYGELHHTGAHVSVARYYPEGTIISSGLSKWCGAGGWRLGTFTFPRDLRWLLDAMAAVASETFTATSAPIQYAAVRAFAGGPAIQRYLGTARSVLAALGGELRRRLCAVGVEVVPPEGGFYLFPDFSAFGERLAARGITTSAALCERLLDETGVAILPGREFGRPAGELTARIAYVDFDGAGVMAAAEALPAGAVLDVPFLERHCGAVLAGADALVAWLTQSADGGVSSSGR